MQSITVILPEPLQRVVDEQIAMGRFHSASDYVCALIREDARRRAEAHLDIALLEGLESEESPLSAEDWASIRDEARARLRARRK